MIQQLYEPFKKWTQNGRLFVYSDPHFEGDGYSANGDEKMMKKIFDYADADTQIKNINKMIGKGDTLVIEGDIGYTKPLENIKCKNLILIYGNHDYNRSVKIYEPYFKEIYQGALFISPKILLSHEPMHSDKYFNFHGHIHNIKEVDNECYHDNYVCVSANLIGYKPVCIDDLIKNKGVFAEKKISLGKIKDIHRQTIDRAIERKIEKE